jgi:hypothetical protein
MGTLRFVSRVQNLIMWTPYPEFLDLSRTCGHVTTQPFIRCFVLPAPLISTKASTSLTRGADSALTWCKSCTPFEPIGIAELRLIVTSHPFMAITYFKCAYSVHSVQLRHGSLTTRILQPRNAATSSPDLQLSAAYSCGGTG